MQAACFSPTPANLFPPTASPVAGPSLSLSQIVPKPSASAPLWALLAALLPPKVPGAEFYTPGEIAEVVGLRSRSILHHCRDLFPGNEGQYRLSLKQAELVLIRVCAVGRKLPQREDLEARLKVAR